MCRIVVNGSNSFSGSHFVETCLSAGHEVLAISRSPELSSIFLPYRWHEVDRTFDRFRFLQARLPDDIQLIEQSLIEFQPEYVVNFAALGMVAESWQFPVDYYRTNVVGNVAFHESLRRLNSLKKYVHVSTPEVYGNTSGYINESAALNPTTPYAASRAACDIHLQTFFKQYNFPVVWTRAANVFGPGQQLYRIIPRTIIAGELGPKLQLHGGGSSERSFIHIKDVCKATLTLAVSANPGDVYHLSTLETTSVRNLVERVCNLAGYKFEEIVEVADERPGKDAAYFLESSNIRNRFDWKDEISLDSGIDETIQWIRKHLDIIKTLPVNYEHVS